MAHEYAMSQCHSGRPYILIVNKMEKTAIIIAVPVLGDKKKIDKEKKKIER